MVMTGELDDFEEKWGDFGEETRHRKISHHQKKQAEDDAPKVPEKTEEQIQSEAETKILRHIESRWGILTPEYRTAKLKVYFKWIKSSLEEGFAILDDGDLGERTEDDKKVLTHEPTLIGAKKKTSEEAKGVVFERLEEHLKPWKILSTERRNNIFAMGEVKEPPKPDITFVFTRHSERDAEPVWEKVKDADIIILEAVGITEAGKSEAVDISRNNAVASDPQTSRKVEEYFMNKYPNGSAFIKRLISMAILNGKELHLADVSLESEGAKASRIAEDMEKEATYHATLGFFKSAYIDLLGLQKWESISMIDRDHTVAVELLDLIEKNQKEWQGKKVAVIYGKQHTNLYKIVKNQNPDANLHKQFMSPSVTFSLGHEIRQRIINGQEFPTEQFRRKFLEHFVIIPYLRSFSGEQIGLFEISDRIARKMTESDVESAFDDLQKIESEITEGSIEERISEITERVFTLGRKISLAVGERL